MPLTTEQLFEAAVRLHSRRLLAIARGIAGNRAGAEDVVQQAITNLYQHRERYDWDEPGRAGGLMRRAVVNEALRLLRQPRLSSVGDDYPDDRGSRSQRDASPADRMIDAETVQRVRRAINRLPEHFRAALVLCEYEQMPYAQISEVLGASVPQVKTWLHRGRRQLAEMLRGYAELDADGRMSESASVSTATPAPLRRKRPEIAKSPGALFDAFGPAPEATGGG